MLLGLNGRSCLDNSISNSSINEENLYLQRAAFLLQLQLPFLFSFSGRIFESPKCHFVRCYLLLQRVYM